MKQLHMGRGVTWPASIAAQAIGVLGMRGAGKSNLGRVYAEELFGAGIPFVVFDPIGNWSGIRAGRDGRPGGGLPIPIFGGQHGDLDIDRMSGPRIADLVIDRRLSCVLDLSHEDFSEADKQRFLAEFGDRLFRRKARESGWLVLIMEEADDYAPQPRSGSSVKGPALATLGMFQKLVRRGRFKGLGTLMITQRSAAINKDLLYMVGTLVVFRTTGPRDQEAVAGWVKYNSIGDDVVASLAQLEDGEAWTIAQEALGTISRTRFRQMQTYDTGATPEHGGSARPATLVDIDVPALRTELAAAAEKRKAEDPTELRKQVAALKKELERKEAVMRKVDESTKRIEAGLSRVKPVVIKDAQVKRLETQAERLVRASTLLASVAHDMDARAKDLTAALVAARAPAPTGRGIAALIPDPPRRSVVEPAVATTKNVYRLPAGAREAASNGSLGKGERAVLTAAAQYGDDGVTREQLTVLTGYKRSARDTYLYRLRTGGYVEERGDSIRATSSGLAALGPYFEPLPTGKALAEHWLKRLSGGEHKILRLLIGAADWVDRDYVTDHTGYKRSARDTYIYRLANRKLVDVQRDGTVRAALTLFD